MADKALSAAQIATVAKAAGFSGSELTIAVAVAFGESGGVPTAVNHNTDSKKSTDFGLWQINDYWNPDILRMGSWSNPADNARMAYAIYKRQGWKAWYAYSNGSYLAHMPKAIAGVRGIDSVPTQSIPDAVPAAATSPMGGGGFGNQVTRAMVGLLGIALLYLAFTQMAGIKPGTFAAKLAIARKI